MSLGGGAGPQSAQLMAEKASPVVLTGNCEPNAFQTFGAAGIQVITGVDGRVREAVEKFKSGQLAQSAAPTVRSHLGTSRGMGGGMGWHRGRTGHGRRPRGWSRHGRLRRQPLVLRHGGTDMVSSKSSQTKASTPQEEAERLKQTAQDLRRQLEAIEGRIGDLAGNKNAIS